MNIISLIKCKYTDLPTSHKNYFIIPADPATGILYITENSPDYISGHVRLVSYPTQPMTILTFYLG